MTANLFYSSDIHLLANVFNPKADWILIYDPENRLIRNSTAQFIVTDQSTELSTWLDQHQKQICVLFNLSEDVDIELYCHDNIHAIFSFDTTETIINAEGSFSYVRGENQAIEWVFPLDVKPSLFLAPLNWKQQIIKAGQFLYEQVVNRLTGVTKNDGLFTYFCKSEHPFDKWLDQLTHDGYGLQIKADTSGRKALLYTLRGRRLDRCIKIPLSKESNKNREQETFERLKALNLHRFEMPKVTTSGEVVLHQYPVSQNRKITNQAILNLLSEVYEKTTATKRIGDLKVYGKIGDRIKKAKSLTAANNGMDQQVVNRIIHLMDVLYLNLQTELAIPVGFAYNDFTAGNLYARNGKLGVYDLEKAEPELPLLYDLFQYVFDEAIRSNRLNNFDLKKKIEDIRLDTNVEKICQQYQIFFELHLQLYLLYHASLHLNFYMRQQQLSSMIFRQLSAWEEVLTSLAGSLKTKT